ALQPAVQPPLRGGEMAGLTTANRVHWALEAGDLVERLGPLERQRRVSGVRIAVLDGCAGYVAWKVQVRHHRRMQRQRRGVDVVTPTAEIVVRVPRVGGRDDRELADRRCWSNDPGKRKKSAVFAFGEEIVQTGLRRRNDATGLAPANTSLREIAVRQGLNGSAWTVFVEPA